MSGYLYCARAGNYVKIGHSANPKKRLGSLRCRKAKGYRYPVDVPLEDICLEGQAPAPESVERDFHRRFREERIIGTKEWYPANGQAHKAITELPGYAPPEPDKYISKIVGLVAEENPIEQAIWILEGRKTELRIQRYKSSLTEPEAAAWYVLDRASEHLCRQL